MRLGSQCWRRRRRYGGYRMKVLLSAPGRYCCKSLFGVTDENSQEPLMHFARADVGDHIVSSKINHGPSQWR
jgi:hypothetical protein